MMNGTRMTQMTRIYLVSITTLITAFCYKSRFRFSVLDLLLLLFAGSIYLSALHYWVQGKRLKVLSRASWLAVIAGSAVVLYKDYYKYITLFFNRTKPKVPFRGFRGRGLGILIAILLLFAASTDLYYFQQYPATLCYTASWEKLKVKN